MIYMEHIRTPLGYLVARATNDQLISIALGNDNKIEARANWATSLTCQQLEQYFNKERQHFDLPITLRGTPYQQKVLSQLQTIEYGTTCSYSDVARAIGSPRSCRAVGLANARNPWPIVVPCHRVIGKNGDLVGYALGRDIKEWLIAFESSERPPKPAC